MHSNIVSPKIKEICIVANLQSTGPLYIGDTEEGLFDTISGSMLAARLIITAGMGNSTSPVNKLHGPVPIPELENNSEYVCYFYITEMEQQPLPDNSFSNGKGSYITCIITPEGERVSINMYERMIESTLQKYIADIDFPSTITGQISSELLFDIKQRLRDVKNQIQQYFDLSPLFEATSLFDIGLLGSLPENLARLAKFLILHPKGITLTEIEDKESLETFRLANLVDMENRTGITWIIPK